MTTNTIAIANDFKNLGIDSYFVGGTVRDTLMGIESEDTDIVLVGVKDKSLVMEVLSVHSEKVAQEVGAQFPVWIATIGGQKVDFALARAEKKSGLSRKDFSVATDNVTIEDDLLRRDFTINAIAKNILTGEIIDPYGGIGDLSNRTLKHVSEAFSEDPLRVYRAARFAARFGLKIAPETVELCKSIPHVGISPERVGMELKKAMEQATVPSVFFRFLLEVDWLKHHFPQLQALDGLQQDPHWHPEGDVLQHSFHTMDSTNDPFLRVVMVCHDLGKATTTMIKNGRIGAPGHAAAGVEPTMEMLSGIKYADNATLKKIAFLVKTHMVHTEAPISKKRVMRLMREMESIGLEYSQLVEVCRCDVSGRPPIAPYTPDIGQAYVGEIVANNENTPIVNGDMLLEMGIDQGPEIGTLLRYFRGIQDDGGLTKENWKDFLKGA